MDTVAIVITTYNLEKYAARALDSVLKQETDFDYKVIVADDASTDNTINILKKYKKKYPEKIELLLAENNMGSLANSNRAFSFMDCKYFSFLDGDDYWIGNHRLQKQVDFLNKNNSYVMCAGNTRYVRNGRHAELLVKRRQLNKSYSFEDYLNGKMPFLHTSSILVRNIIFSKGIPDCFTNAVGTFEECALRGEDFRRILHLSHGLVFAADEVLSCYRVHPHGIWQGSSQTHKMIESAISTNYYRKYFKYAYGSYFSEKSYSSYAALIKHLILHENLLTEYRLNEMDSYLLASYLNDIRKAKIPQRKQVSERSIFIRKLLLNILRNV